MKKIIVALVAMIATSTVSFGQSYNYNSRRNATYSYGVNTNTTTVSGYTSSNGTYVNGIRITPNIPLTPSGGKARNSRRRSTLPGARRARPRACC